MTVEVETKKKRILMRRKKYGTPVTCLQLSLLHRLVRWNSIDLLTVRSEMGGRALHNKKLAVMWFEVDSCRLRITRKGRRFMSFIATKEQGNG